MALLNRIIGYWADCLSHEDLLAQDISINVRTKAVICPFSSDPFIFEPGFEPIEVEDPSVLKLLTRANVQNEELYYGYPLLLFYDNQSKKHSVAPILLTSLTQRTEDGKSFLVKDSSVPDIGIKALSVLGLREEETAIISQVVESAFRDSYTLGPDTWAEIYACLKEETNLSVHEEIVPTVLTRQEQFHKSSPLGLYNKSLLFLGANSIFNLKLLKELRTLERRTDLNSSALSIFDPAHSEDEENHLKNSNELTLMPFPLNEYQSNALKESLRKELSVITGPPGTGKSQFIINLLVNILFENKSVLFVSHTNEAVNVVNEKLNTAFESIIFRTGRK